MSSPDSSLPDPLTALRDALGAQFVIERQLGQGGMGAVYLARDTTLDRLVAIKVISPDVASSQAIRSRFLQEARAVARLRHPNIVSVFAAGELGGVAYFVMEYVPGESLRDLLVRERRLTGERAERILRDVALALDHAHAQGLVHRDVKPENILLDAESGRAMLTDFGVARALEHQGDGALTQTGMILGSPRYMAPEQASGETTLDGRTDLYALALVGYELYAGEPVVKSGTVASMLVKHLTETPPPLEQRAADVPPHVAQAIARGLEKDPAARWQRGRDFAEAVAGHTLTPTGEVRRSAAPATVTPDGRATGRLMAVAAGVVALAGAAWFALGRGATEAGAAYLVTPFEVQSGDASVRWLREGSVNMLTLTLGQWSDLKVIDYERTLSLLDAADLGDKARFSLDDARALARRAGAGTVVTGQVQTTRDSLIVIARLFDVRTGEARQQAQQGAPIGDDPRPLFDRLGQALLEIAGRTNSGMQLAAATTSSLQAYRAYLDGVQFLNSWQLAAADSAFARAIALDSTFALAYHKRSLGMGWSEVSGPTYRMSAERAYALADRLPPRERALVEGHYHLVRGLDPTAIATASGPELAKAIATYRALIARDSLVAEAWYGLADSYFHGRAPSMPVDSIVAYTTHAVRGFNRTLEIDSTFHLAYSHLVQLYNQASLAQSQLLLVGDSAVLITDASQQARAQGLRDGARARGLEIARAWARADTRSSQAVLQLAQSYDAAGARDTARAVLIDALQTRRPDGAALRLSLLSLQLMHGDTGMLTTLDTILERFTADSLRATSAANRFNANSFLLSAAGASGNAAAVDRVVSLALETDSLLPFSPIPAAPILQLGGAMNKVAMGDPMSPGLQRAAFAVFRAVDSLPAPIGDLARSGSASLPLLAFLATRDTTFAHVVRRWTQVPWTDLDALIALERGDTATAERIARTLPTPDSLRNPVVRFGTGGLRAMARAELLARLGMTRQAAETYEAIEPHRFASVGVGEPGFTVLVRSILTRARLWRQLGEREKAIAAYEEFIARWRTADGVAARQVAEARSELAALRDAPRTTPTVPTGRAR